MSESRIRLNEMIRKTRGDAVCMPTLVDAQPWWRQMWRK